MATLASDTFTATNGTAINAHTSDSAHTWSLVALTGFASGSQNAQIQSNKLAAQNGTISGLAILISENSTPDLTITVDFTLSKASGEHRCGVFLRRTDANNWWLADVRADGIRLYKCQSGATSLIASTAAAHAISTTYTLTVTADGNDITVTTDIAQVDATNSFNASATGYGIYSNSTTTFFNTFDNFLSDGTPSVPPDPGGGGIPAPFYLRMMAG